MLCSLRLACLRSSRKMAVRAAFPIVAYYWRLGPSGRLARLRLGPHVDPLRCPSHCEAAKQPTAVRHRRKESQHRGQLSRIKDQRQLSATFSIYRYEWLRIWLDFSTCCGHLEKAQLLYNISLQAALDGGIGNQRETEAGRATHDAHNGHWHMLGRPYAVYANPQRRRSTEQSNT